MKPFAALAWDSDAQDAVHRLVTNRAEIKDPDYFYRTADLVEECRDPDQPRERLTMTALNRWVERCKARPAKEDHSHEDQPRHVTPQN